VEIMLSWWMLVPFLWTFLNLIVVFIAHKNSGIGNFELCVVIYVAVLPSLLMILTKQMP